MRQKPRMFKEIDPEETTFFSFKLDASTFVLYDSDMGEPVAYGSFNLVGATISKLSSKCTIFYFELNPRDGWKLKRAYKPDRSTANEADKTNKIKEIKQPTEKK